MTSRISPASPSLWLSLLFALLLAGCGQPETDSGAAQSPVADETVDESARLNAWFDEKNEERLRFSPIELSSLGRKELYDRIDDFSEAGAREYLDWLGATVGEMEAQFDYEALDFETKTSWDLWHWMYQDARQGFEFRRRNYVFNQMNGAHTELPTFMINYHVVDTENDMQAYIARIGEIGRAIRQGLAEAQQNATAGVRPPRFSYESVIEESGKLLQGRPFESQAEADAPLFADGKAKIAALQQQGLIDAGRAEELSAALETALLDGFQPAYRELIAWFREDLPNSDAEAQGASSLPDGENYYQYALGHFTTLPEASAEQVHEIGLAEVARISSEMQRVKEQIGFDGDMQAFFQFIEDDDQFYYPNTDAGRQSYLDDSEAYLDAITEKLPQYFGILPKAPLIVKRVEPFREQDGAPQHYYPGSVDGTRPGIYYVHLINTRSMSKTDMETTAYHEGLPGHHMQLSIAQELTGLPAFRGQVWHNAYVEGWALYAEQLAGEMGAYDNPYMYFGHLNAEIWRAIRLVVDTGIHAKGWSEQQAIDYFARYASTPLPAIRAEVRRYIVWPGQATSYKSGMLKILELRELAMEQLGEEFDIREFHDVVLGGGSLPLEILDKRVRNWLAEK